MAIGLVFIFVFIVPMWAHDPPHGYVPLIVGRYAPLGAARIFEPIFWVLCP